MAKILCIDDEPDVLDVIKFDLELAEFEVFTAQSADQALKLLDTHTFNYVLSDVKMPGKDGKDLAREIRGRNITCGIAFLSGFSDVDAEFMRSYQIDRILAKPYQPEQVIAHLKERLL